MGLGAVLLKIYRTVTIILFVAAVLALAEDSDYDDLLLEGETPRPPPPALLMMLANSTDRHEDLTACMNDYATCYRLQVDALEPICAVKQQLSRTFTNMCLLQYVNCKEEIIGVKRSQLGRVGPKDRWEYIYDGPCDQM